MKDRLEFRFTVATGKVDTKSAKSLAKLFEPFVLRLAESFTKTFESYADAEERRNKHDE